MDGEKEKQAQIEEASPESVTERAAALPPGQEEGDSLPMIRFVRPDVTKYDPELFIRVCDAIEMGGETILDACRTYGVGLGTLYRWGEYSAAHAELWARVRLSTAHRAMAQVQAIYQQLMDKDYWLLQDNKPALVAVNAMDRAARLMVEYAKRMAPKDYGDKIEQTNASKHLVYVVQFAPGGGGGSATPLPITRPAIQVVDITPAPEDGKTGPKKYLGVRVKDRNRPVPETSERSVKRVSRSRSPVSRADRAAAKDVKKELKRRARSTQAPAKAEPKRKTKARAKGKAIEWPD